MSDRKSDPNQAGEGFDPRAYWQRRHAKHATTLRSVGHIGLSDADNVRDYERKEAEILGALRARFPDPHGVTLLDAGCGVGHFAQVFLREGFAVTGVDFSETAVEAARLNGVEDAHLADLASFDLGRRFDAVTCIDVLFHVIDDDTWRASLGRVAAHVGAGGVLLLQDCFADPPHMPARHVKFRPRDSYLAALAGQGLRPVDERSYELPVEKVTKSILVCTRG